VSKQEEYLPPTSPEKATYGGQIIAIEVGLRLTDERIELTRQDCYQVLRSVKLPHRLAEFLWQCFSREALNRCAIEGSIIYVQETHNIPGTSQPARNFEGLEVFWNNLKAFTSCDHLQHVDWVRMARAEYQRGSGIDLGETGRHMTAMMRLICDITA